ncbi:MAG: hypothetical protein MJZ11_13650 [Lachnospiraceae bacterium]|nr:hypothetical protein [Lachnospiraceae bacterium]
MTKINHEDFNIDPSRAPEVLRPLLKTGLTALTCVYPELAILTALISSIYAETRQNSTQKMLEELKHEFDELNSRNLISEDYLYSDSYASLMIDILRKIHAFNKDEKRKTVARIYKGVVQKQLDYDESNEKIFLDALEKITAQEILILDFFDRNQETLTTIGSWSNLYELFLEQNEIKFMDKYKFKYFASQLEQMGLVFCSDLDGFDNNSSLLALEDSKPSSAGMTPMGREFLVYLKTY